jgi:hypothetical protein
VDTRIADLDPELPAQVRMKRTLQIREEAVKLLSPWMRALSERAEKAEALARTSTKEAELRRTRFHPDEATNAAMTLATFARLQRSSTVELVEHMEDAAAAGNLALAEAVRLEFRGRPERERNELRDRYVAAFSKLEPRQAAAAKQAIGKIRSLTALGQERFNAVTTGRSDPVARMNAARMAAA